MSGEKFQPGDRVLFGGKLFTVLEKGFGRRRGLWLCVETDNAYALTRYLIEDDLKPADEAAKP